MKIYLMVVKRRSMEKRAWFYLKLIEAILLGEKVSVLGPDGITDGEYYFRKYNNKKFEELKNEINMSYMWRYKYTGFSKSLWVW